MGVAADPAVERLLASSEPAIVRMAHRDLLGEDVAIDVLGGSIVRTLLDGPLDVHPYKKWQGAHWRLVSLAELELPPGEPRVLAAADAVLDWLTGDGHRRGVQTIDGLARRCASQEGNALAACCRLGLRDDPRVQLLAHSLVEWQWPDGGWNCDTRATGYRSSFNESLAPMWGLFEYGAREAAERTAELFLEHRLFRSLRTGEPVRDAWLVPHYPPYWHYDVPQALLILWRMGKTADPRAQDGLELLRSRCGRDGLWRAGGRWWRTPGSSGSNVELVDWSDAATEMLTLNALRVLR
jgi:hypothetical protein